MFGRQRSLETSVCHIMKCLNIRKNCRQTCCCTDGTIRHRCQRDEVKTGRHDLHYVTICGWLLGYHLYNYVMSFFIVNLRRGNRDLWNHHPALGCLLLGQSWERSLHNWVLLLVLTHKCKRWGNRISLVPALSYYHQRSVLTVSIGIFAVDG